LRGVGILTAGVYLLNCLFYLRGPQVYSRTPRELWAWFCVLSLLWLFRRGYQLLKQGDTAEQRTVVRFAILFCLLALLTFPFHSTDVFGYINRGWQQMHYGQNPYAHPIADIHGWQQDPMMRDHWIYNPNPYGFLFTLLARLLCEIGRGHWWPTLFLFKGVNVLAYALTAWLIWMGKRRLGHEQPLRAIFLFLWNPLVLMHLVANGHNDILTGYLLALSMYLAIAGAGLWLIPVLVAATLLKYAPVVLLPFAFIFVVKKHGWRIALAGCLIGAFILVLTALPYMQNWQQLRFAAIATNATLIDNSLHSFLIHIFENFARLIPALAPFHELVNSAIELTLWLGFLLFLFVLWWRLPKNLTAEVLLEKSVLIMFVLIYMVSSKLNGWYAGIVLPPALLLPERHWLKRLVVLVSCAQLLSLTFFKQAYIINYAVMVLLPCWFIYRQERKARAAATTAERASGHAELHALQERISTPTRARLTRRARRSD